MPGLHFKPGGQKIAIYINYLCSLTSHSACPQLSLVRDYLKNL